jgi:deoxyribodipyrimidine photo-lyase
MYLFIHRKDLRTYDLPAFRYIRQKNMAGIHLFVLDPQLLSNDRHLEPSGRAFLQRLEALAQQYQFFNKKLYILQGDVTEITRKIIESHTVQELIYHHDITPYAIQRDHQLNKLASARNIPVTTFFDSPLVQPESFQKFSGKSDSYKVFTPFFRKWSDYLEFNRPITDEINIEHLMTVELDQHIYSQYQVHDKIYPVQTNLRLSVANDAPRQKLATFLETQVEHYKEARDQYHYDSTSRISLFLNTGAISAREVYQIVKDEAMLGSESWIRQLAWRDFYLYQAVMNDHFFQFEEQYDLSALSTQYFEKWARGETGIPIIDAAMRELNETGHLHNRLRMVVAMFLTKNLLCPFTLGEQHFRRKLLDYDNTLNRGGWLWSSSLGYDGAPYFRIMNPVMQSQRFDPNGVYIKRWLPEFSNVSTEKIHQETSRAIVDLKDSRQHAIEVYKQIIASSK